MDIRGSEQIVNELSTEHFIYGIDFIEADRKNVESEQNRYIQLLEKRLKHLLKSDYIRQFDEKDPQTGEYKLDIHDADKPMPHWIPCSERMPEKGKNVLVYGLNWDCTAIAIWCDDCWLERLIGNDDITHWMPLPELPKGGGEIENHQARKST